jgi:hypothetical protein
MTTKFRVLKMAELTKRREEHHRRLTMMPSFIVFHTLQLLAGGISPGHTSARALPGAID